VLVGEGVGVGEVVGWAVAVVDTGVGVGFGD